MVAYSIKSALHGIIAASGQEKYGLLQVGPDGGAIGSSSSGNDDSEAAKTTASITATRPKRNHPKLVAKGCLNNWVCRKEGLHEDTAALSRGVGTFKLTPYMSLCL